MSFSAGKLISKSSTYLKSKLAHMASSNFPTSPLLYTACVGEASSCRIKSDVGRPGHLAWLTHILEFFIPYFPGAYCFMANLFHKYQFSKISNFLSLGKLVV